MRLAIRSMLSYAVLTACAALAAGCYTSSGAPPSGIAPAAPAAPAGPPPTVTWIDNGFDTTRLPAVSADGSKVLIPTQDSDGGRGNPNFRVAVKNREDAEVGTKVVLTVAEAEPMFDGSGKHPELDKRITAANQWLAEQNTAFRLQPLAPLEVERNEADMAADFRATGSGVTIEWKENRVTIVQGGKVLVDRATPATWLVKDKPMYPGARPDETCHNPAFLQGASIDVDRKIALLTITYYGTDSCWEPPATHHVIAW
jgi:uncharacterized protein (DUF736 family)